MSPTTRSQHIALLSACVIVLSAWLCYAFKMAGLTDWTWLLALTAFGLGTIVGVAVATTLARRDLRTAIADGKLVRVRVRRDEY